MAENILRQKSSAKDVKKKTVCIETVCSTWFQKEKKKEKEGKKKEGKEKGEKRKKEIFAFSVVFMLVINFKLKITRNNETERNIFFSLLLRMHH